MRLTTWLAVLLLSTAAWAAPRFAGDVAVGGGGVTDMNGAFPFGASLTAAAGVTGETVGVQGLVHGALALDGSTLGTVAFGPALRFALVPRVHLVVARLALTYALMTGLGGGVLQGGGFLFDATLPVNDHVGVGGYLAMEANWAANLGVASLGLAVSWGNARAQ